MAGHLTTCTTQIYIQVLLLWRTTRLRRWPKFPLRWGRVSFPLTPLPHPSLCSSYCVHKYKLRNYYTKTYTLAHSLPSHNLTLSLPFPWVVCIGHHIPLSNAFDNSYMLQPQVQADVNSHMLLWFSSASQAINLLVPLRQPASSAVTPP